MGSTLIELHLPDFRWRRLEGGYSSVSVNIKDTEKAVERSGGGVDTGRVDGDDAEAVTSVGSFEVTKKTCPSFIVQLTVL